jgi:hypothetical protein
VILYNLLLGMGIRQWTDRESCPLTGTSTFSEFRKRGNDRLSVNKNIWVVFEVDYGKTNSDLLLQCGPPAITKDDISDFCRSQYVVNVRARFCCFSLDELSGVRVALFGFGLMPNHFHAVLELVLAVAADTGVWNSKYVRARGRRRNEKKIGPL